MGTFAALIDGKAQELLGREAPSPLVMTAVGGHDAAVAGAEQRAGNALREMMAVDGVSLRDADEWCGDQISVRAATRLRRRAGDGHRDGQG
jgi:hypothetical protein